MNTIAVTLKGTPVELIGKTPHPGCNAHDFLLTQTDLSDVTLASFSGSLLVLNIFPSIDTSVCAASVRRFNQEAAKLENVKVLCISLDLPFAHSRFCETEGIRNVIPLSELRNREFGDKYGIRMTTGPLAGLFARSVVIIGPDRKILYAQLVPEITREPDYENILNFMGELKL